MKNELNYESPKVRIVKVVVEKGFAVSTDTGGASLPRYHQGRNAF